MTSYKRTFVPQIDARDCGVAALASIAKFYGSDFSLAHLRELAKTNKEGTTALGIVKAADEMGFETRPVQADKTLFDMSDVPYPFIVHVNKEENSNITMLSIKQRKTIWLLVILTLL